MKPKTSRDSLDAGLGQIPTRDLRRLLKHITDGKPMIVKSASIIVYKGGEVMC